MILKKLFSFRSFSKFCGCVSLLEWRWVFFFFCNNLKSDYKLAYWWILFRAKLKKEKCSKTLRCNESRTKLWKVNKMKCHLNFFTLWPIFQNVKVFYLLWRTLLSYWHRCYIANVKFEMWYRKPPIWINMSFSDRLL